MKERDDGIHEVGSVALLPDADAGAHLPPLPSWAVTPDRVAGPLALPTAGPPFTQTRRDLGAGAAGVPLTAARPPDAA